MRFEKWQALGNDYVIVEAAALPFELTPDRIKRICDPHFGVGSDGILLLTPVEDPDHVAELRIFNPDGSEAELSGNGAREAVLYLRAAGWTDEDEFSVITKAGPVRPTITGPGEVRMEIGRARDEGKGTLNSAGREWSYRKLSVVNPQCVVSAGDEVEDRSLPGAHERVVHPSARLGGARPDLRARGGGDALFGHWRFGRGGRGVPGGRGKPDHGAAGRRAAHRRDHG